MTRLTEESKELVESYVNEGFLHADIYPSLWRANKKSDIMKAFKDNLNINEITLSKVWMYIIHSVWTDINDIFEGREIILLKEILKHDGVVMRTAIKGTILNEYMTTKSMQSLQERGIIDVLVLSSNEKICVISPRFRDDVFNSGTE